MLTFSRFARYFVTVAKTGSLRKAADLLSVSPSTIDRQILRAEETIGTSLFHREATGLVLTAAGLELYTKTKSWQNDFDEFTRFVHDMNNLKRGTVTVGIVEALSDDFMPLILTKIRKDLPGIIITLLVMGIDEVSNSVANGSVDIGMTLSPAALSGVRIVKTSQARLGVAAAPQGIAQLQHVTLASCRELPVIMPAENLAVGKIFQFALRSSNIGFNPISIVNSITSMKSLVRSGIGVAILTSIDVSNEVKRGDIAFVPFHDVNVPPIDLALCIPMRRTLSEAAQAVLSAIERDFPA